MIGDETPLSVEAAEMVLRHWLGKPAKCRWIERLHGGKCCSVLALDFDAPPHRAVAKVSPDGAMEWQFRAQGYMKSHCKLPVPEPYLWAAPGELFESGVFLMERIPGVNLGAAEMTPGEHRAIDIQLAELLLEMHSHQGDAYGEFDGSECQPRWVDWFGPTIHENLRDCAEKLTDRARLLIPPLLRQMPEVLAPAGPPTMVHGDLWTTNIMVDKSANGWAVTGFVDPCSWYTDVEYELAYLEVFKTVGPAFFDRYHQSRPERPNYETRRLYYWLNTLMLHVWLFGDQVYVDRTEQVAEELAGRL